MLFLKPHQFLYGASKGCEVYGRLLRSIDTYKGIERAEKELAGYRSLNFMTNSG
jgi:hypothetical protein